MQNAYGRDSGFEQPHALGLKIKPAREYMKSGCSAVQTAQQAAELQTITPIRKKDQHDTAFPAAAKMVVRSTVFFKRREGISAEEFHEYWVNPDLYQPC